MCLHVTLDPQMKTSLDTDPTQQQGFVENVMTSLKRATSLSGAVQVVEEIADDGIVVDDQRSYD